MPADSVPSRSGATPSGAAADREEEKWLRLALHYLEPDDRRVILLREWRGSTFEEIGKALGIAAEAARQRFRRALPRLLDQLVRLKGEVGMHATRTPKCDDAP